MPIVVVEEDRVLRLVQLVLDPNASRERFEAYADYMRHDCADFADWCDRLRAQLQGLYPAEVRLISTAQQLQQNLPDADVLVLESLALRREDIDAATRLKLVQQFGHQDDNIDVAHCAGRGITVRTVRRRTNTAVAEHTLALILALAKRLPLVDGLVTPERLAAAGRPFRTYDKRHTPGANFGRIPGLRALREAKLGVLGFGEIGAEVATLGRAFGMDVLYHKRNRLPQAQEQALGVTYCSFDDLFARADFLSIHLPLDGATRGVVDAGALRRMPSGAFLINTSRAEIVERTALTEAVARGTLGGVALDVLYEEPAREDDPLLHDEKVLLTPHIAGASRTNGLADMRDMLIAIADAVRGRS